MRSSGTVLSNSSVDRLGDRLRAGNVCADDLHMLQAFRQSFQAAYQEVHYVLQNTLKKEVTGRPSKSTISIVEKLRRETIRLSQIQDIAGCRVIVDDVLAQNRAVDAIEVFLRCSKVDRRANPSHGYRAVHLMAKVGDCCVEIQVRTALQHHWAEISEKMSDILGPELKYGKGDPVHLDILRKISSAINDFEAVEMARAVALSKIEKMRAKIAKPVKKMINSENKRYHVQRQVLRTALTMMREQFERVS